MTNDDAIKWLENLKQDIGQLRHEDLWPYAQAIDEICGLLEEQHEIVRCKDCKYAQMTVDGELCKYCEADIDEYGYPKEVYHEANWFCADGERR